MRLQRHMREMQVIIVGPYVGGFDNRQAWDARQRSRVPRQVVENLLLVEEDSCIARMGRTPNLNAKEAPIDLVSDVLCRHVALGEKPEAKTDPS